MPISFNAEAKRIFQISPFREFVNRLMSTISRFQDISAGTVHTTQGKQANIVVLVLGSNPNSPGARQYLTLKAVWIVKNYRES